MNIALEQTKEFVDGKLRRNYGDAFVRGNNGRRFALPHVHFMVYNADEDSDVHFGRLMTPALSRSLGISIASILSATIRSNMRTGSSDRCLNLSNFQRRERNSARRSTSALLSLHLGHFITALYWDLGSPNGNSGSMKRHLPICIGFHFGTIESVHKRFVRPLDIVSDE